MSEWEVTKRRRREGWVWWHRWKGHRVLKGYALLAPTSVYKCEDCGLIWARSLL